MGHRAKIGGLCSPQSTGSRESSVHASLLLKRPTGGAQHLQDGVLSLHWALQGLSKPWPGHQLSSRRNTPQIPAALAWLSLLCLPTGCLGLFLSDQAPLAPPPRSLPGLCRPRANSLKVFSNSSQRRTSTTKRLWKALTEALSCGCAWRDQYSRPGGQGGPLLGPGWLSLGHSCLPQKVLTTP